MFGKRSSELSKPPLASEATAVEVLRVWAKPGSPQQIVLNTTWKDPGAWGLVLSDIARHAAKAYAEVGIDEIEALNRIFAVLEAETNSPTDDTKKL